MAFRILQMTALTAALLVGGAMAARAAPDDEIKYRDGKPVSQTDMTQGKAGGGAAGMQGAPDDQIKYRDGKPVGGAMADEASKPAKKSMKSASSKKKSMKKTSMKRKPGMKRNSSM